MTARSGRHQGDSGAVARVVESARTRLWPLPLTAVIISLVIGDGLLRVDAWADDHLPAYAETVLFGGDADAARSVLETIAGSLMTVTSLTFSLTVVTLQLASSQFSPRLLRTFAADRFVQATLALFLSTFVFALTVLRSVRSGDGLTDEFIPRLSVTVTFVLTLASVLALVLFLAHLAREIRVETMLDAVHRDAEATIERELDSDDISERDRPGVPHGARPLLAERTGFLQSIDAGQLCRIAGEHDLTLRVVHPVGAWIVQGTPWVFVEPPNAADLTQVERSLHRHLRIGVERSGSADISFGLRQITDVAVKALSPGINDPTTAVHALSHSAGLLCLLAERSTGTRVLRDSATDEVRVVVPGPTFADLLDLALAQPRRYGATEPAVLTAMLRLLRAVAWSDGAGRRRASIGDELDRTEAAIAGQDFDHATRADLANQILAVRDAFARRWRTDEGQPGFR